MEPTPFEGEPLRRGSSLKPLSGFFQNRAAGAIVVCWSSGGREPLTTFKIEIEREDDGRWLAEVVELPGILAYGDTEQAVVSKVQALALSVIAERLEHGETRPEPLSISFNAA
jgi:predicted RNase H-like HicB family nuclease